MSESNNFKFKPIPLPASKLSGGVPGTFYTVIVKREKLVAWWPRGVDGFRDEFKNSYDDHSIVSFVSMGGDGLINDLIYRFDEVGFVENRDYFLCDILTETLQWSRPRTPPWLFSWRMPEGIHFFRIEEGTEAPKPFNIEWITKKNETSLVQDIDPHIPPLKEGELTDPKAIELMDRLKRIEPHLIKTEWAPMTYMLIPSVLKGADQLTKDVQSYNFRTGTDSRHILGILVRLNYLRTAFHRDVNGLKRICPKPMIWADLHKKLLNHARDHHCLPEEPPKPVILAAWAHTTDIDKLNRWRETMRWCAENGCSEILRDLPYKHYYTVKEESS